MTWSISATTPEAQHSGGPCWLGIYIDWCRVFQFHETHNSDTGYEFTKNIRHAWSWSAATPTYSLLSGQNPISLVAAQLSVNSQLLTQKNKSREIAPNSSSIEKSIQNTVATEKMLVLASSSHHLQGLVNIIGVLSCGWVESSSFRIGSGRILNIRVESTRRTRAMESRRPRRTVHANITHQKENYWKLGTYKCYGY